MAYLVFSGRHLCDDAEAGWYGFCGRCLEMESVQAIMALQLAERMDWLHVVDTDVWQIVSKFESGHPECTACKGKGNFVVWVNSVSAHKPMRPLAKEIPCSNCGGHGDMKELPKIWKAA